MKKKQAHKGTVDEVLYTLNFFYKYNVFLFLFALQKNVAHYDGLHFYFYFFSLKTIYQ